jgi:hypothetical protein
LLSFVANQVGPCVGVIRDKPFDEIQHRALRARRLDQQAV